jgi:hypothetical protein
MIFVVERVNENGRKRIENPHLRWSWHSPGLELFSGSPLHHALVTVDLV